MTIHGRDAIERRAQQEDIAKLARAVANLLPRSLADHDLSVVVRRMSFVCDDGTIADGYQCEASVTSHNDEYPSERFMHAIALDATFSRLNHDVLDLRRAAEQGYE